LPHYTEDRHIEEDPTGQGPAALEVEFAADSADARAMGAKPMTTWVGVDPEVENVVPLAKQVVIAGQRVRSKEELQRALAGQPSLGTLVVSAGGETKRVGLDGLVQTAGPPEALGTIDKDVTVGGTTFHLKRFLWKLAVEANKASDQAPGGPLGL